MGTYTWFQNSISSYSITAGTSLWVVGCNSIGQSSLQASFSYVELGAVTPSPADTAFFTFPQTVTLTGVAGRLPKYVCFQMPSTGVALACSSAGGGSCTVGTLRINGHVGK